MLQLRISARIVIYCFFLLLVSSIIRIYPFIDLFEANINILFNIISWKVTVSASAICYREMHEPKSKIKAKLFCWVPLKTGKFEPLCSCRLLSVFPIYECEEFSSSIYQDNYINEQATDRSRTRFVAFYAIPDRKCNWTTKTVDRF